MVSGTACKLKANIKTAIEPGAKNEASATSIRSDTCPEARESVRGTESQSTSHKELQKREGGSVCPTVPSFAKNPACTRKCIEAPMSTPHPKPVIPKTGYKSTIPAMIPRL